tara:strand:+ start:320 stop:916 length:597 start_codon:yes stop_codon:yes gene_type:complete
MFKKCSKCFEIKPKTMEFFSQDRQKKDGLRSSCRKCGKKLKFYKLDKKQCNTCGEILEKNLINFSARKDGIDGLRASCRKCETQKKKEYYYENKDYIIKTKSNHVSKRRCLKLKAVPNWISKEQFTEIKNTYLNANEDQHVDHIIPLVHDNVCGLHVPWNLQILSKQENWFKSNKFDGTNDNMSWKIELYSKPGEKSV